MVEFLRKFENRDIKIARAISIRIKNKSIYFNFGRCQGSVVMLTFLNQPQVRSPLIEKSLINAYLISLYTINKLCNFFRIFGGNRQCLHVLILIYFWYKYIQVAHKQRWRQRRYFLKSYSASGSAASNLGYQRQREHRQFYLLARSSSGS